MSPYSISQTRTFEKETYILFFGDYDIHLIDTPGLGDTTSIETDMDISNYLK